MTSIISSADDRLVIPEMSDYIVNTVWGLLTGMVFVSQTAVKTVNFDDLRSSPLNEDSDITDDRSRVTPDAAEHANADTADVLDSIWWPDGGNATNIIPTIVSIISLIICLYTYYRNRREEENRRENPSVEVKVNVENDLRTAMDNRSDKQVKLEENDDKSNLVIKSEAKPIFETPKKGEFHTFSFEHNEEPMPNLEVEAGNTRNRRLNRRSISISRRRMPTRSMRRQSGMSITPNRPRHNETPPPSYEEVEDDDDGNSVTESELERARREGYQQAYREMTDQTQQQTNEVEVRPNNISDDSDNTNRTDRATVNSSGANSTSTGSPRNGTSQTASNNHNNNNNSSAGTEGHPIQAAPQLTDLLQGFQAFANTLATAINPQTAPKPVIDKQKVPDFAGEEEKAFEWFREFERIALSNKWRDLDKTQAVANHLKKKAQEWYYGENVMTMNWEEFVTAFKRRFFPQDIKYAYLQEFNTTEQGPNESATEFFYRLKELAGRVDDVVPDQSLIRNLIRGVHDKDLKHRLNLSRESLDRVIQIAKSHDSVEKYISKPSVSSTPATVTPTAQPAVANQSTSRPLANINSGGNQQFRRRQGFNWECANCGRIGHRYADCRQPRDEERIRRFQEDLKNRARTPPQDVPKPMAAAEGGDEVNAGTGFASNQ